MISDDAAGLARDALSRGDLLQAYDLACRSGARDAELDYLKILALARMGEAQEALQLYDAAGLYRSGTVDQRALKARLLKDLGFSDQSAGRGETLEEAMEIYRQIFDETGDYYPGINAATLAHLQGRLDLARTTARAVLAIRHVDEPNEYYAAVTKAEAHLILGDLPSAQAALTAAVQLPGADSGSRSTTRKQLGRLATSLAMGDEAFSALVAPIEQQAVTFFCGHIFKHDDGLEAGLRAEVDARLAGMDAGFGYGALAAGADILVAEALLDRGAELHVVLPFAEDDFIAASVDVAGPGWLARYDRCKSRATTFAEATSMGYVGDPLQFAHGSTIAMGLARLRARFLGAKALQLALWDGGGIGDAGTGADVAKWRNSGGQTEIVTLRGFERPTMTGPAIASDVTRRNRAIIFADLPGFTKIPESLLPTFWENVMGTASRVLAGFEGDLENSNTWGDALYLIFRSATAAAAAMEQLQRELTLVDHRSLGFSSPPTFRVAGHYAPVYVGTDPVTGRLSVYGVEVSKAARIEPVTPPGSIYITASFAAQLEMESPGRFDAVYMGRVALAKAYGEAAVYRLTASRAAVEAAAALADRQGLR